MDFTSLGVGGGAVGAVSTVFWWLLRRSIAQGDRRVDELKEAIEGQNETIKEQGRALDAHKLHVAEHYVTNNELTKAIDGFNRAIDAVFKKLDRIEEKVDRKADKD